jgi:hypothetical protein
VLNASRRTVPGNPEYLAIILGQMQGVLRPAGFRRAEDHFYAEREDTTLVVQLACSPDADDGMVDVMVNLGVFSHPLAERLGSAPVTDPREPACHWRQRLDDVIPMAEVRSWQAHDLIEALEVGAAIAADLKRYGLPALERVSSTDMLRRAWLAGESGDALTEAERRRYLDALGG